MKPQPVSPKPSVTPIPKDDKFDIFSANRGETNRESERVDLTQQRLDPGNQLDQTERNERDDQTERNARDIEA